MLGENEVSTEGFFFLRLLIYLFMRDTQKERERKRQRQREKQAPSGEANAGLDPRTPGSGPEPKADVQALSHLGAPHSFLPVL